MNLINLFVSGLLALVYSSVKVTSSQLETDNAGQPSNRLAHNPFLTPQQSAEPQSVFPVYLPIVNGDIIFPEFAIRYTEQNPDWEIYENSRNGILVPPTVLNKLETDPPVQSPEIQPTSQPSNKPMTRIPNYPSPVPSTIKKRETTTTTRAPTTSSADTEVHTCAAAEAFDLTTRKCHHLATQGPCSNDEWWILSRQTNQPECRPRPCPAFFTLSPRTQTCILKLDAEKEGLCGVRERLINDVYGDSRCACINYNYKMEDGVCYPTYERGPCMNGYYVLYNTQSRRAECRHNPCNVDGFVLVNGVCYELGAPCGEHGEKNVYVNPHDGVVGCYDFFRLPIAQSKV